MVTAVQRTAPLNGSDNHSEPFHSELFGTDCTVSKKFEFERWAFWIGRARTRTRTHRNAQQNLKRVGAQNRNPTRLTQHQH